MGRQFRPRSPEGMRAHNRLRRTLRAAPLAALLLLCACFAIAIGADAPSLTVANLTPHVLTLVVGEKRYPALEPGEKTTYRANGTETVRVRVSYAEGQDLEGSAERTFALAASEPGAGSGTSVYWACAMASTTTAPASGIGVMWEVRPDTLVAR